MSVRSAPATAEVDADVEDVIARLAKLSAVEYARVRKSEAEKLGVPVTALDEDVKRARPRAAAESLGQEISFEEIEPWPDPVDTTELLDDLVEIIGRHVVLSDPAVTATALWVLFTYVQQKARVSPILAIESPDMRCGKTTLLRLLDGLIARPLAVSNISAASLFRVVEQYEPSLLIDEADAFLKDNEELRGILNSGHTRGTAYVIRTVGEDHAPRRFSTWCPKAIALIGDLPRTLTDRAVVVQMRRKRPDEVIDKLPFDVSAMFETVRRRCVRWAETEADYLNHEPKSPSGMNDRATDNWSALFAIADTAFHDWPERARAAAVVLAGSEDENEAAGVMLLADLRTLFEERDADRLLSAEIVPALTKREDRPWVDWYHGKPITVRQVARLLRPFGIHPKTLRAGDGRGKGYEHSQFADAFARYLPSLIGDTVTTLENEAFSEKTIRDAGKSVTDKKSQKPLESEPRHGVTDENPQPRRIKV